MFNKLFNIGEVEPQTFKGEFVVVNSVTERLKITDKDKFIKRQMVARLLDNEDFINKFDIASEDDGYKTTYSMEIRL